MIDFSFILPTRDRPQWVERLFESILATTIHSKRLEVILYIDTDDKESAEIAHPDLEIVKLIRPRKSMGAITRACYEASRGRYIVLINDDVVLRTAEWDRMVKAAFETFPDDVALVYPNDWYYGKKMATFPILTRRACELMEKICPPEYQSHCIDSHVLDIFAKLAKGGHERRLYLPHVVFEHMQLGLGAEAYDGLSAFSSDDEDRHRYRSLEAFRERIADRMADHIQGLAVKSRFSSRRKKTSLATERPRASAVVLLERSLSREKITECLEAIASETGEEGILSEIILLAFGCTIKTPLDSRHPLIKNMRFYPYRKGPESLAAALSQAALNAKEDHLIFLDVRSRPRAGWLKSLLTLAKDRDIALAGSKWLHPKTNRVEHAGIAFYEDRCGPKASMIYRGSRADDPRVSRLREFQAVELSGMLVKKAVFSQVGGFRSTMPSWEHVDFCLRVRATGKKVVVVPDAILEREHEGFPANLPSSLQAKVEKDLPRRLLEDGFALRTNEGSSYILPSEDRISKLRKEGRLDELRELLEKSLALVACLKGTRAEKEFLEAELASLDPSSKAPRILVV